ncbi:transcriptional regulator, TetR family [Agromyces sp. CF514]|uniref:TetR/AcrR family transcriptional regulator n=1 Tax=Agromyces sp. CF514 TaxID=1881031 RepID=UPI0008F0C4AA|nr:TetR/AcrR family transcriptional regulator [Agromyces sp. CF514]SFR71825.1 transcriptional regulator, TetR family [Agromyces sp. CF514]
MPDSRKSEAPPAKANRGPGAGPENRRAILAAAREIFAESGLQVPYSAIAKRAGVGQGSLYRHFPDKTALALAVFDENFDALEASVALPDTTLDALIDDIIDLAAVSTALIDLIWQRRHEERVAHLTTRLAGVVGTVVARDRAAGRLGDHVADDDVLLAITMLVDLLARTDAAERRPMAEQAWAIFRRSFAPERG